MRPIGNNEILAATVGSIPGLAAHAERVAGLASAIVELREEPTDALFALAFQAAHLHDLGKLAIPADILRKPGSLTSLEYTIVKRHPAISDAVARAMGIDEQVCLAVLHHHEWWNGRGYPHGLAGETIPLMARIIAVADAFDAMTSDRPYREAMSVQSALEELTQCAGTQFDPHIVTLMVRHVQSTGEHESTGPVASWSNRVSPGTSRSEN